MKLVNPATDLKRFTNSDLVTAGWVNAQRFISRKQQRGSTFTSTTGAVSVVHIPHGLGVTPSWYLAQPANSNASGASAYYLTADSTNVTLNFASALSTSTSYSWVWVAST